MTVSVTGSGTADPGVEPGTPVISLVIPTFNEAANIAELLTRLEVALPAGSPYEVIFVDDSTDETPAVINQAARTSRLAVSLRHRPIAEGGLGGAVVVGLREAAAPWVVVMDADLQHPPALVPQLVAAGERTGADLVIASRYVSGGGRAGLDGALRKIASGGTTVLAKVVFWRRLHRVSDPMSGFFAVRAEALDADVLRPLGYKILLELIVRCRIRQITEVPYQFQDRFAGQSKASLAEGLRFLQHLVVLRFGTISARLLARPGRRTASQPVHDAHAAEDQ